VATGEITLSIDVGALPAPERLYYANTMTYVREGSLTSFAFGQFQVSRRNAVQSAMGIDMPDMAVTRLVTTFNESFRQALDRVLRQYKTMSPFPSGGVEQIKSIVYPAHLLAAHVNDFECALDFFSITLVKGAPEVDAVMRIRCFAPVVAYFVKACDDVAAAAKEGR
jgi:hypothetical protein